MNELEIQPRHMILRALIVEDDPTNMELIRSSLTDAGHSVEGATSAEEALEIIKFRIIEENPFDIIYLDINLPKMNGVDFCRRIRQKPEVNTKNYIYSPNTWVIMVTTRDGLDEIIEGLDGGANDYMLKPVTPRQLAAKTHVALWARARTLALRKRIAILETEIVKMSS